MPLANTTSALDLLPEPVLVVSLMGDVIAANRAALALYEPIIHRDPKGMSLAQLVATPARQVASFLLDWMSSSTMQAGSLEIRNGEGQVNKVDVDAGTLRWEDGSLTILIRFRKTAPFARRALELTEQIGQLTHTRLASKTSPQVALPAAPISENRRLQRLGPLDPLTQLADRRCFDRETELDWSQARRRSTSLALVLFDVDNFGHYNDHYGQRAGDRCLRQIADTIGHHLRLDMDLPARFGGEEFAALLPATNARDALNVAERILQAVRNLRIAHSGLPRKSFVTISAGVGAFIPIAGEDHAVLLRDAEQALALAKTRGRDRVVVSIGMRFSDRNHHGNTGTG